MDKLTWHIEEVKWSDLKPFSHNARKIKAENKKNLLDSINEFGMAVTPTVDFDNVLIGGHQRWQLMNDNGHGSEVVSVMKPNRKLTEAEFKKLNLLLNSHKYTGEYDVEMLNEYFTEFKLEDFGIDVADFSSSLSELDESLAEPEMPIVPKFSEKYSSIIIVIDNEIDENNLSEKLGLQKSQCYKSSKFGMTHVISSKSVIEKWK